MCGICGFFGKSNDISLPIDSLNHRGPDGNGETVVHRGKLGHTRLAIIDVSNGEQPMYNEDRSISITFNGEIYNHKEIRENLKNPHIFETDTDTEVVLHLFEEEGWEGLKKLDGMFAVAIMTPDSLTLARDPLGIKPLYILEEGNNVHFASEIKSFKSNMDKVKEFPEGHIYNSKSGYYNYYELPKKYEHNMGWYDISHVLNDKLKSAVEKRLMADVPLGSFLSGGLDSSIVTALIKDGKEDMHTFSVALEDSSDRYYAKLVSDYLGTNHHEYLMNPEEIWNSLPEVIYYLESFDRSLVRSSVANYFLSKIASQYVKVTLTGEGADELFAGYDYLSEFKSPESLHQELFEITSELHNTNLQRCDRMTMAHGLEGRVPFLDKDVINFGLNIPPWFKRDTKEGTSKWCLRRAFDKEGFLPEEVIYRGKEKFSDGSGVSDILEKMAEDRVSNQDYYNELEKGTPISSKEEYYYFSIFASHYGRDNALSLIGRSRS